MAAEEIDRLRPRIRGRARVVDLLARVVEERVVGARVGVELVRFAQCRELLIQLLHDVGSNESVLAAPDPEHWCFEVRQVRMHLGVAAVEHDAGPDVLVL